MVGAVRFAAAILASLGAACASPVQVHIDQRRDFSGYCTWNFLSLWAGNVDAPLSDARDLNATLTRLVERDLLERGFVRVQGRPDFYVTLRLEVRRQYVITTETPAVQHLPSLHRETSYDIQVTQRRVEAYEIGNLAILVSDPDEEGVVWRGGFEGRFRGAIEPHLKDAVSSLLERLPSRAAASGAPPAAGAPGRADPSGECGPRI